MPSMNCRIQENDQDLDSRRKEVREKECYLGGTLCNSNKSSTLHYMSREGGGQSSLHYVMEVLPSQSVIAFVVFAII